MFSLAALRNEAFSWQTSLSLALASKLAYENSSTVENVAVRSWGFKAHRSLEESSRRIAGRHRNSRLQSRMFCYMT